MTSNHSQASFVSTGSYAKNVNLINEKLKTRFNGPRNSHYNARNNDLSQKNEKFTNIEDYN